MTYIVLFLFIDMMNLFAEECLRSGTIDMLPVKCIVTGMPGVGKTSFLNRIANRLSFRTAPTTSIIPSTGFEGGITVNITNETFSSTQATINRGVWVSANSLEDQAKFMLCAMKKVEKMQTPTLPSKATHSTEWEEGHVQKEMVVTASKSRVDITKELPKPSKLTTPKKALESAHSFVKQAVHRQVVNNSQEQLTSVCFIDTGGQPEFHELLPPLLHGSAFHLIFFNAFLDLFKSLKVVYRHQDPTISSVEYETTSTSMEIIYQLLVSFFSISRNQKHESVAALIGSYIDQFDSQTRPQELQKVSNFLQKAFEGASFLNDQFLISSLNEKCNPYIFQPIDNVTCSEKELERVLDFITDVIQRRFAPVSLPLVWAAFHLTLRHKYETSPGVCTMAQCTELAIECNIPSEHVPHVLQFFHYKLGTILHYKEVQSLEGFVIVNPNVLFKGISNFVTLSFIGSGEQSSLVADMRRSGEIPSRFVEPQKELSEGCPLSIQHVIDLLVHFKLLYVPSNSSSYFMPCLLLPDPDVVKSLVSIEVLDISPPPMMILFEDGFVPIGFFSGLTNILSEIWHLIKKNRFRNRVTFNYPPGVVELRNCIKYIEVRAIDVASHCNDIRKKVLKSLDEVISVQPHLNGICFFYGFYCPGSLSSYLHPCKYIPIGDTGIVCLRDHKCYERSHALPAKFGAWFGVSK